MSDVVLCTLNAKYVHSSLALRYLEQTLEEAGKMSQVLEYTINGDLHNMAGEIYQLNPKLVAFSCYIWNIDKTLTLASMIKKVIPEVMILLGGPEVSFDSEELLKKYQYIDYIMVGEGETEIVSVVDEIINGKLTKGVINCSSLTNMASISSPVKSYLKALDGRIAYYESSRGCPFNCQYCLSSTIKGVRFLPLERVFEELDLFIEAKVKQVKFVDRTFNVDKERANKIWQYLINNDNGLTNFHFEIAANLLDEGSIALLSKARKGLFQFEIGVQSTNPETLEAIQRKTDFELIRYWVTKIKELGNIHQHLDLIVGLPYEDWSVFVKSFNQVFALRPDMLQVGFLKLLRGSGLRKNAHKWGLIGMEQAPYQILTTHCLSFKEILELMSFEDVVEKFYNSHPCDHLLELGLDMYRDNPFDFFYNLKQFLVQTNTSSVSNKHKIIELLAQFLSERGIGEIAINDRMVWDYLEQDANLPNELEAKKNIKELTYQLLSDREFVNNKLPRLKELNLKQLLKKIKVFNSVYPQEGTYLYVIGEGIRKI